VRPDYNTPDPRVKEQVQKLDALYGTTPYYAITKNGTLFIVMKGKYPEDYPWNKSRFTGEFGYGVADSALQLILPCAYDKVYNPGLTLDGCMEIKKGNATGFFHFSSHEVLEPQFEYIVPTVPVSSSAYGFREGNWYRVSFEKKFEVRNTSFSPVEILRGLSFNVSKLKENAFFSSYSSLEEETGAGVVITPSYIERLGIMPEVCDNLVVEGQNQIMDGTSERSVTTEDTRNLSDRLISFVVSFYEEGVGGREYTEDSKKLVVYNSDKENFSSQLLNTRFQGWDNVCHNSAYKFISDSLVEVQSSLPNDDLVEKRYGYQDTYTYKQITRDGNIIDLHSTRYYDFTKYVEIDERYFRGCFVKFMDEKEIDDSSNIWVSDHLTVDDLDLMINEIYAEYGLIFKNDKWKNYFSAFPWYKPRYENVESMLSELDKKNIQTIAAHRSKMKGREHEYVKRRRQLYMAAG
jgi:hypothetical protein